MRPSVPPGAPRPWQDGASAVYHITYVGNIASMVQSGVIRCDSGCSTGGIKPVSIAHEHIKSRRSGWPVRVARGGTLPDYVPFYFAPRSPMLYAISTGYVVGYEKGQDEIAHLVLAAEEIADPGLFAITDGHASTPLTTQYDDLAALDSAIAWPIMRARYWNDTDADGDRKRRRQAEFLVWSSVPFRAVRVIGVRTAEVAERVRTDLAVMAHAPAVVVRKDWYY
jgi:hypothetical protein